MNEGASITAWSPSMSVPPNQRTMAIITEPSSSLTGWALAWRTATRVFLLRIASVTSPNLADIFFSARKALMILRPPSVSSTWLMVSLQ